MITDANASAVARLALLAIGNKDAAQIWMLIDRFLAKDFMISVSASADIALLDSEAHGYTDALRNWQADHPGAPAIVFSADPPSSTAKVIYVRKPLNIPELIAVLGKLGNSVREANTTTTGVLSVDICMARDPVQVLDTIGIASDISGDFRYPGPAGTKPAHTPA